MYHVPVLLNEVINLLLANKDNANSKLYVDSTLGGGGYTEMILNSTGSKVIAIDRDINSINHCKKTLENFKDRIIFINDNFGNIKQILNETLPVLSKSKISGLVLDLGLSSYQLTGEEGFSYQKDTELDMRADRNTELTAKEILNDYPAEELLRLLREYGELKYYKQLTRDIIAARKEKKFKTTFDLVDVVKKKIPPRYLNKDLSKIFQALRIEVNDELENLRNLLTDCIGFLENAARIAVVSYHSLEDRIVKNFFRMSESLKVVTKKPVVPSNAEIAANPRARSAKLRAAECI